MKYIKSFNESSGIKENLESLFPNVENLELIGSGKLGTAYIGNIGNALVVCKMTNSLSEYYMTKMAMASNPPHTVKFHDAKVYNESKYFYGIVHDYISRDAMPNEGAWNMASEEIMSGKTLYKKLVNKEQRYEYDLAKKKISELEKHFGGIEIDTLWDNWGYDDNRNLVIFDLDGNVSRPKYEKFIKNYNK